MPYIDRKAREEHKVILRSVAEVSGELNFQLTQVVLSYLRSKEHRYVTFNDILGAFEGAKLEFYRRVVVPYEDQKIKENGDVY